jgi:hypothetical protein
MGDLMAGRDSSNSLRAFVATLLDLEEGAAEPIEPQALEYAAPADVSRALGIPEFGSLSFGSEIIPGSTHISFESDWIDRLSRLVGNRGVTGTFTIDSGVPPLSDPGRAIERGLTLNNAVYRLVETNPSWTRYLYLAFRYTAVSDEQRDGIARVLINLATGSTPDDLIAPVIESIYYMTGEVKSGLPEVAPDLPALWPKDRLAKAINQAVSARVLDHLSQFVRGMLRRISRDQDRLVDYYEGLRQESINKILSRKSDEGRERTRIDSIIREYRAKVADLSQKYKMAIQVEPIQTIEVVSRVHRFKVLIKRRKAERMIDLDWSPFLKRLEPPPCEYSFTSGTTRVVCDDALHLVSVEAHAKCLGCSKEYCRACAPSKCPRCGRSGSELKAAG